MYILYHHMYIHINYMICIYPIYIYIYFMVIPAINDPTTEFPREFALLIVKTVLSPHLSGF